MLMSDMNVSSGRGSGVIVNKSMTNQNSKSQQRKRPQTASRPVNLMSYVGEHRGMSKTINFGTLDSNLADKFLSNDESDKKNLSMSIPRKDKGSSTKKPN